MSDMQAMSHIYNRPGCFLHGGPACLHIKGAVSAIEAVRLENEFSLAEDFAAVIHARHMRFLEPPQEPLAAEDCIEYDEHYGLAWELVRHLAGPELDAEELDQSAPWNVGGSDH